MSDLNVEVIKEHFPGFTLPKLEDLSKATPSELQKIFSDLSEMESSVSDIVLTQKAELGHKKEQMKDIMGEIKKEFGVSTIEELEKLRDKEIKSFNKVMAEFEAFLNQEVGDENGEE